METLPLEIVCYIFDYCSLPEQITLTQINHYYHNNLKITDFYNIDEKYQKKLTDDILKRYPYIKKLNAYDNLNITDEGIKHLDLNTLNASLKFRSYADKSNITEDGIKHMNLKFFKARNAGIPLYLFWKKLRFKQLKGLISTNSFITKEQTNNLEKVYDIHDNGGRPYKVIVKNKEISIYKQKLINPNAWKYNERFSKDYNEKVLHLTDFIGYWYGFDTSVSEAHGNTILIQVSKYEYIIIQENIVKFETTEEIIEYISPVGNNDVPYPVAYSKNNIYFMLDNVYIPKNNFKTEINVQNAEQLYSDFYDYKGDKIRWKNVITLYKYDG